MSTSPAKNWNTIVSLAFLALSLTYTGWSTYRSIVGQEMSEEAVAAAAAGDEVRVDGWMDGWAGCLAMCL